MDFKRAMGYFDKNKKEFYRKLQIKNQMMICVIDSLVNDFGFELNVAQLAIKNSSFQEMLEIDPVFVGHYDVEYWAEKVKEEFESNYNKNEKDDK